MIKPTGAAVAAKAIEAVAQGHTYAEMDCQALVEYCVNTCGGKMAYAGSNDMARNVAYLATLENAKAEGKLVPGAGLLIHEENENGLPAKYRGDGLGDFSHVGLYVGENALTDTDKNGKNRKCNTVHASASRGRVCGGTTGGGWTHAALFREIDYAGLNIPTGVAVGGTLSAEDVRKDNPEGVTQALTAGGAPDVSGFFTVKRGCKGGAVMRLQTWLYDLPPAQSDEGCASAPIDRDGDFGPETEQAVKRFQANHGLNADGVVGQKTWRALAAARQTAMEGERGS